MIPVRSGKDEAASSSHGEITTSSYGHDVKMKRVDYTYIDPQLYEAELYMMNCVSGNQGEITPTSDMTKVEYLYMDPRLYEAAAEGNFERFDKIEKELSLIVTPDKNTVLHIHVRSPSTEASATTEFMKRILDRSPSLLLQVNALGDTPLHVAARNGHATAVGSLISSAKVDNQNELDDVKQMLRKTNNGGNTALHEAVRHRSTDVVEILTKEDPDFSYSANNLGETPLYIAVEKGWNGAFDAILQNCSKLSYEGPNGRTPLHAAAKIGRYGMAEKLLEKEKSLAKEVDQYGWTPLHYAVYYDRLLIVQLLLKYDVSAAYIGDKERKMTPLHLAGSRGVFWGDQIMDEIVSRCPTCYELVDIRGWNVLHYAIPTFSEDAFGRITKCLPLEKLIPQKDVEGNTPFHLFISLDPRKYWTATKILDKISDPFGDYVTNKQGICVQDIIAMDSFLQLQQEILKLAKAVHAPYLRGIIKLLDTSIEEKEKEEELAEIERARGSHLVVAALIATVTFAAAFTLPGGFIQDGSAGRGTAILKRNTAFQAFVISNALAMVLSVSAVFIHFIMSLKVFGEYVFMFWYAFGFTLLAMGAMVIAFITGAYAMLAHLWLSIFTILIGLTYFFAVVYLFIKVLIRAIKMD